MFRVRARESFSSPHRPRGLHRPLLMYVGTTRVSSFPAKIPPDRTEKKIGRQGRSDGTECRRRPPKAPLCIYKRPRQEAFAAYAPAPAGAVRYSTVLLTPPGDPGASTRPTQIEAAASFPFSKHEHTFDRTIVCVPITKQNVCRILSNNI